MSAIARDTTPRDCTDDHKLRWIPPEEWPLPTLEQVAFLRRMLPPIQVDTAQGAA